MGNEKRIIPLLPLRGILVFPNMVLHLDVGREKSVNALEKAMVDDHRIYWRLRKKCMWMNQRKMKFFKWEPLPK